MDGGAVDIEKTGERAHDFMDNLRTAGQLLKTKPYL